MVTPDWASWAQTAPAVPVDEAAPSPSETNPPEEPTVNYEPSIADTGDAALQAALQKTSTLFLLRTRARTTALGLIARAQRDTQGMLAALRSEGYYDGTLTITIAGEAPEAPGLADRLQARPADGPPIPVVITANKGEPYRVESVTLVPRGEGAEAELASVQGRVTLPKPGDQARAQPILDAASAAVEALKNSGHPFAAMTGQDAEIDPATKRLTARLFITPGPFARYGVPVVSGNTQVKPALTSAITRDLAGQPAAPQPMDEKRRALLALGVFDAVRARAADRLAADGTLPVTYEVSDRPRRAIGGSIAYETRYGPSFGAYWEHRNLLGGAEKLRIYGEVSRLGEGGFSSPSETMNGKLGVTFTKPWFMGENQKLIIDLYGVRERLDPYDRDAVIASVQVERPLTEHLTVSLGPFAEISRITRNDVSNTYHLVGLNGTIRWDNTDSPLDPSRGYRASALLSPTWNIDDSTPFLRARLTGSTYIDMSSDKSSILALRGSLGTVLTSDNSTLPYDRRFYAGGGGSVRGYGYQRIGPRDSNDDPIGGFSVMETSVELRQKISGPWGMAAFVDGGAVSESGLPSPSGMSWGAGLGVRYSTGIGPIRADVAVPLNEQPGDSGFGLYIGIGQAF
ncbi:BamA/TamA family outer membrane protein [Acetobacteraceae bacterium H6797]|nr:BamA/TamA family outer membrane protein [Acetobacteraceae bacterium H6797]